MNAVGYVRRSKESTDRTVSLDVQEAQIRAYAERLGVEIPRVIIHDGISGGDGSRFIEIHDAIRQANAKVLIVYHLDRLARDTEAFLTNCRVLAKRGVDLHVVGRGRIDLTTASGKLLGTVEAAMAEHYRAVISEKTKDALALRRAQGKRVSRFAPYGYRFQNERLVPVSEEQEVMRRVRLLSEFSLRTIAARLAREGVRNREGRALGISLIHKILKGRKV